MTGSQVSHYLIVSRLGAGGMGEVWLAEDTRLDRRVALKMLPAEFTQDAGRVHRFVQEARAASALSHPNIITIYDIGESEAGRFIVMELVAGRTLRDVIAEEPSLETILPLGRQMAEALEAAHAAGITHRDLKPDNIMVRNDGYVKVLDFGLARLSPVQSAERGVPSEEAATLAQQTTPGMVMGTVAYMSPEQARGEQVSHPTDVFSLGIVLYELSTGRHPFQAETLIGRLHAITLQEPPPPAQLKPELPAALSALIVQMLSKDASRRPTAGSVAQTLQDMERRGVPEPLSVSDETMLLPAAPDIAKSADEGFRVAVLPFKWRGANADLEALADGLAEDIVTGLSRFSYLRVIARGSTLRYADDSGDVRDIGREIGARYVMEGSLRQAGSMLRVAVHLVDAGTGAHLWAETYDRPFRAEDIFQLQDDLVPVIVSTVADWYGVLPHSMSEAVRLKPPDQLSPYEAVLRSFGYFERIAPEEHAAVRAGLERAVEREPGNADGWAMLSMMYGEEHRFDFNMQPDPLARSLAAARRAVDAAHANHFAWLALAQALFFRREFDAFREAAERAIALNPMDGSTLEYLGHLIAFAGDWERGSDIAERARGLNPNHPGWYWTVHFLNAYRAGDYHNARQYLLKISMRGGGAQALEQALSAALCGQLGEREAAEQAWRTALNLQPDMAQTVRDQFEKWYLPELVKHLMDGLHRAGLVIDGAEQAAASQPASDIQTAASPAQSIAVLPFANISADEENEYFCDGLAEELINALARIDELKVAARTSAFSFKGRETDIREIGQRLNVGAVLEGSVRKAGNRLRITAQLVNVADGYRLWSEQYDREMKDIFDIQDEITLAIVDALKVKLFGVKKAAVLKRYTDDAEVHELFLKGRYYNNKYTAAGWQRAMEFFERAIARQPDYAPAHAGIAAARGCLWFFGILPAEQTIPPARAASLRALGIDETLADAHLSLAIIRFFYDWDWDQAEREFLRATTLNPNHAEALSYYAIFLGFAGRFAEAASRGRRALEIDPLSPLVNMNVGWAFFSADMLDEAAAQAGSIIETEPDFFGAYWLKGAIYLSQGDYEKAVGELTRAVSLGGHHIVLADLGAAYGLAGKRDEATAILDQLLERGKAYVPAICPARVCCRLGEHEKAIEWLEKAYEERNGEMVFLKGEIAGAADDDALKRLGDDARVRDLLQRMNLPE